MNKEEYLELLAKKNETMFFLGRAVLRKDAKESAVLAKDAAAMEEQLALHHLEAGDDVGAVINLISRASCLATAGACRKASEVYRQALSLSAMPSEKRWIEKELKKLEGMA